MKKDRKGIRQRYRDLSVKKFFGISLCLFLFPVLLLQLVYIRASISNMNGQINTQIYNNLSQVSEKFMIKLESYKDTVYQIYSDKDIIRNLEKYHNADDAEQAYRFFLLNERLKQFVESKKGIRCISLICTNGESVTYDAQSGSALDNIWRDYEDLRLTVPYQQTSGKSEVVLIPTQNISTEGKTESLFFLGKELYNTENLEQGVVGTLIIGIEEKELDHICNGTFQPDSRSVNFITDAEGFVLSFPDVEQIGKKMTVQEDVLAFIESADMFECKKLYSNWYQNDETGWIFHNVYDQDYVMRDINVLQAIYWVLLAVDVLAIALFINSTNRYYVEYLKKIIEGIRQINEGNLDVRLVVDRQNELGQIGDNFNHMVDRVRSLIKEVEMMSEKKNQAEIKALEAQINPHFLYNTLDAINWMAVRNNEFEISKMISNLGSILRYSTNQSNEQVEIVETEEWLKAYVSLYQLRYGHSFEFKICVEHEVRHIKIYKLLIQPIVENAIIHGIKDTEGGMLRVDIGLSQQPGRIHVIVEDNGAGMDKEKVDFYNRKDREWNRSERIGLANVFERIQLYYGEAGGWHISSMEGLGTIIELILPFYENLQNHSVEKDGNIQDEFLEEDIEEQMNNNFY